MYEQLINNYTAANNNYARKLRAEKIQGNACSV